MKKEKKTNCLNCKYWNIYGGCYLYFLKEQEKKIIDLKYIAKNDDSAPNAFIMPPKPPRECKIDDSMFYKKDGKCIWYKFNLFDAIFNRLHD